jgi:hypothetical protein
MIMQEGFMDKKNSLSSTGLFLFFLSACTAGELSSGTPSATPSKTMLPSLTPTETIVPTPTLLNTVVPIPSPTEGPPPDLELLNISVRYRGNGVGIVFGEIRNNTGITMVFPGDGNKDDIPILRFQMEAWEWDILHLGDYWYNEFSVGWGSTHSPNTNCLLYPGETSIIRIYAGSCAYRENCIIEHTKINEPPEATGMQLLGYQDLKTYIPWPDLYQGYHPQVENLEYSITNHRIEFGFDLPKSIFNPYYNFMTRVVAYDKSGKILGFLYRGYTEEIKIDNGGDDYHITGYFGTTSDTDPGRTDLFRGDLLDEDLDRIDHIQVMVEKQHTYLCYSYRYDLYRKYIANHPEESGA